MCWKLTLRNYSYMLKLIRVNMLYARLGCEDKRDILMEVSPEVLTLAK